MSSIQQKQFIHGHGSTVSESEPWTAAFIARNGVFVNVDNIILKTYSDSTLLTAILPYSNVYQFIYNSLSNVHVKYIMLQHYNIKVFLDKIKNLKLFFHAIFKYGQTCLNGECLFVSDNDLCFWVTFNVDGSSSSVSTNGGSSVCLKRSGPLIYCVPHSQSATPTSTSARKTCNGIHAVKIQTLQGHITIR